MTQLHLDLHGATHYLNSPWSYGVNVSRASLLLSKDIQRHLHLGRDELGFRHIRFTGIFDDDMNILQPDGSYDFTMVERAFDWLMEQGFSPFIGLSGVPSALRTADAACGFDQAKWIDMARALAAFVDGRYGCDAQEWHYEVWPGADNPAVWTDSREAFFRFYDRTARAIRLVNGQLKVGGSSATDVDWTTAFIDHLAQPSEAFSGTPAVTKAAAGDDPLSRPTSVSAELESSGTSADASQTAVAEPELASESGSGASTSSVLDGQRCDFITISGLTDGTAVATTLVNRLSSVRIKLTEALGETTPLILSAWNRGGPGLSVENDRCAAGGFVADVAASTAELVSGVLYDCLSDIDQHGDANYEPFHGGRGLLTVNDVRKASFNALRLLNEHVGYKLEWRWHEPTPGLTAMVTKDYHNVIRILASYDRDGTSAAALRGGPAKFSIEGLPESVKYGQVQVLRPSAGSALEAWKESGCPMFVNRYMLDNLEAAAHPATAEVNFQDFPPRLEPGMTLQLTIPLPDDVMTMD
ncbi:GH39 family glycosyl hydrolase [Humisphaera borealis]|uniref:Glycosyl hydrolases family 39 N-terminal catalytic domain-containing protein n=1 Tax=Humisphaera borealis TaxID=2807512 RepID=A0A7M2WPZ2_9BACT|nr:hypothetical protein [Humisphaera borealis]QOV87469.1 hypothetical protein IPV69_14345 [Humisphaera borealis]